MKLASFIHGGKERFGAKVGETALLDLQSHWPADRRIPGSMIEFIEFGQEGLQLAAAALAQAGEAELILLPELWASGFDLERTGDYASRIDQGWFRKMSSFPMLLLPAECHNVFPLCPPDTGSTRSAAC